MGPTRRKRAASGARVRPWRKLWAALLGAVAVALLWAIVFVLPSQVVSRDGLTREQLLDARNDVRTSLLAAVGGAVALVGGLVGGYVGLRQLDVGREGQITERFTRAIDQLGNEKLDVRLGAIYALERIARDSRADQGPIVEVLTSYLRGHHHYLAGSGTRTDWSHYKRTGLPAPDLQAVLRVLGRRNVEHDQVSFMSLYLGEEVAGREVPIALDLTSINLFKVDFRGADLRAALIKGSDASLANLTHANLEGAVLVAAQMRAAGFEGANLRGAFMVNSDLVNADFSGADLRGVSVSDTDVAGAVFDGAMLQGADLRKAQGLTKAQVASAVVDGKTRLPAYLA